MRPVQKVCPEQWDKLSENDTVDHKETQFALIDYLGEYCSYCEKKLGCKEVEHHRLFKEWRTPLKKKDWDYLLLICGDCRLHLSQHTLEEEAHNQYLWPDRDLSFCLHDKSPLKYSKETIRYVVTNGEKTLSEEQRDMVLVKSNPQADSTLAEKAQRTIDLFQLNTPFYDAKSNQITIHQLDELQVIDHRVTERNLAWEEAEAAVKRLKSLGELSEMKTLHGLWDVFHQQISLTAVAKGNWSVWMTVFWQTFQDRDLLTKLFIQRREEGEDEPFVHFLGTHQSRIQWQE